ncbi:MAG: hypothetical protein H8E59_03310 [Actinobacteria bacterium]|nr:hypothetical protein [Actinomycetota bacterium]
MLLWFAALSLVLVAGVFDSPNLDYRLVVVGAVLPVAEGAVGGPWLLHTLPFCVAALFGVMLVARGRRFAQRRWLGVPIGLFAHLFLDGTWTRTEVFWWPFAGIDSLGGSSVPEFSRWPEGLAFEVAGAVVALWAWRRYRLGDPSCREALLRQGRLTGMRS